MPWSVQEVVDLIVSKIPGAPFEDTVDVLKSGDARQRVTGIVTTFIATAEVIEKARRLGANLIITHEPTYYDHRDGTDWLVGDPVYEAKRTLILDSGVCIWRFHDYWHSYVPDGILTGFAKRLGWEAYRDEKESYVFRIPATPLAEVATRMKGALGLAGVRVVGKPETACSGVAALVGSVGGEEQILHLRRPDIDLVICGETVEWQVCEYVRDGLSFGRPKALVILGHEVSEEPGMEYLVEWLQELLPGERITHVPAGDPIKVL